MRVNSTSFVENESQDALYALSGLSEFLAT